MSKVVYYVSYKLKKKASTSDFLAAAEKLNNEFISKQKGYVSWQQLYDGKRWVDLCTFETEEDLNNFKKLSRNPSDLAKKFYSYMNPFSIKQRFYTVEKNYQ